MAAQASTMATDPMQALSAANAIPTTGGLGISKLNYAASIGNLMNVPFQTANAYEKAKTNASNYEEQAKALEHERATTLRHFDRESRQLAGQQTISYIMSGLEVGAGGTPSAVMQATASQRTEDRNLINLNYGMQIANAYRAANAEKKKGKNALFGGIAQTASTIGALYIFSDERLKENLTPVGKADNGLTIYIGNYTKESGLDDGKPHLFLIAQEVQKIRPDAVVETESGYLAVDYVKALL